MALILDALCLERARSWHKLVPEMVVLFRDGDSLRPVEAEWLADWLACMGRDDLEPSDVQVVQISRDWAAEALGGHQMSASRALRTLQVAGVLTPIHKGIKGHASLYCVNPLPGGRGDYLTRHTGSCEGKYPNTLEKYPNTLAQIP